MSDGLHGGGEAPAAAAVFSAAPLAAGAGAECARACEPSRGSGARAGLLELIPPASEPLEDLRECFNDMNMEHAGARA